jgi:hypothetical protein
MDDGQHLVDNAVRFADEMDQDFTPIVWMGTALHETSAFKRVKHRSHAGAAHEKLLGDHVCGERLARSFEDGQRLEGTGREAGA